MITDLGPTCNKAYLSAITVTNISLSFTYKMAAKINWQRYGTKLRHCHVICIWKSTSMHAQKVKTAQ